MNNSKLLLVTGAGDGLGREVSIEMSKSGYDIVCISKSSNVHDTARAIDASKAKCFTVQEDISNYIEIESNLSKIPFGNYDSVSCVYCAAVLGDNKGILDNDLSTWTNTFNVNVISNLRICKIICQNIIDKKIISKHVFLAGGGSAYAYPDFFSYSLSKTAVVRAVENLAAELSDHKRITFYSIAPGAMKTKMLEKVEESDAYVKTYVPISETVGFISNLLINNYEILSGKFIHVRDYIDNYQNSNISINLNKWTLRRNEE